MGRTQTFFTVKFLAICFFRMMDMRWTPLTSITLSFHACGSTMHAQWWYHTVVTAIWLFCTWLHGAEDAMLSSDARGSYVGSFCFGSMEY